jgi:nucleotide-binding universal stress UspA family protein
MADIKNILVAVDFGKSSEKAMELGVELARKFDASLTLVHAYEIPSYAYPDAALFTAHLLAPVEDAARKQLESTLVTVQERVPGAKVILRKGAAATEILAVIDEVHPDLVVTGTHGRRGLSRTLLGSVAEKVVRLSPVPVLTVRGVSAH